MRPHISLNVRDVQTSVEFYRKVFGVDPQKQTADYAKFDLTRPPLNFALLASAGAASRVNHLGIEVDSPGDVATWERHLHEQGILDRIENDVTCCYARQRIRKGDRLISRPCRWITRHRAAVGLP